MNHINAIYGGGYRSLYSTQIRDVEDSIFAYGVESLAFSFIYDVANAVHCVGIRSCQDTLIENVTSVVADGRNALSGASIVGRGETLYVSINNDNPDWNSTTDIFCTVSQFLQNIFQDKCISCLLTSLLCFSTVQQ